jgi:NAD(P)-dependent dehydrogenase (short-subunit alcohol dehydrogenase family)
MEEAPVKSLVFGGHSPIAIAISREIALECPVVHISRNVNLELRENFFDFQNVDFFEWTKFLLPDISERLGFLGNAKVSNLVFAHRYRKDPDTSTELEQFVVEVYFPYLIIMCLYENAQFSENASILFVTSPAAQYVVSDQSVMYHLSKASINQLVKFLSIELSPKVKVNAISPGGYVLKPRNKEYYSSATSRGKRIRDFLPLAEIPSVEDVALISKFLLSKSNSILNGQIIDLSGGYLNKEVSQVFNSFLDS